MSEVTLVDERAAVAEALRTVEQGIRRGLVRGNDIEGLLTTLVNGFSHDGTFAEALANDHPTLIGQVAKQVGIGVARRCLYDPEWQPYDPITQADRRTCERWLANGGEAAYGRVLPEHAAHDGRIDCATFIGASMMARQSFI